MAKDSQLDPKEVRKAKAKGGPTFAQVENNNHNKTNKKKFGNRKKPNGDK